MDFLSLFLIGIGLSMDAFAVALCKGLSLKKMNYPFAIEIGLFFGGFQALMPFLGWLLGSQFADQIAKYDHWIAFGLLATIGAKMIWEAWKERKEERPLETEKSSLKELFVLSIATSIDALAVGVGFAFMNVSIGPAVAVIGGVTFVLSFFGVWIGNIFGSKFQTKAEIIGGIILILIGLKILLQDLGVF